MSRKNIGVSSGQSHIVKRSVKPSEKAVVQNDKKANTLSSESKQAEEQLLTQVKQYLHAMGYNRAYEALKNERVTQRVRNTPTPQQEKGNEPDQKTQILQLFDKGAHEEFFKAISRQLASNEEEIRKFQFQLHIYFCIYSIHPNLKKQAVIEKSALEFFRKYLDTRGAELSSTSEFLSFFALPYMQRPQQHNVLSHIFTNEWLDGIRGKLVDFLNIYCKKAVVTTGKKLCALQDLFYGTGSTVRAECEEDCLHLQQQRKLKEENRELKNYVENLQANFKDFIEASKSNLLESNRKWFNFAKELLLLVKRAERGEKVRLDHFERFFRGNVDEHIQANEISLFERNSQTEELSVAPEFKGKSKQNMVAVCQIDMGKIKLLFKQAGNKAKGLEICMVLRALKDRLASLKSVLQRREIIIEYVRHDVCGLSEENANIGKGLLNGNARVRDFYLKLMSHISMDMLGIMYLIKSKELIETLADFFGRQEESHTRKSVLAILQRVSFIKKPRMQMISLGIISTIFQIFRNERDSLPEYSLQYLVALMMNLSLNKQSRKDFESHRAQFLPLVIDLFASSNLQIRSHINGTLYLLLVSDLIKAEAHKNNLVTVVQRLIEAHSQPEQQYVYVLKRLNGEEEVGQEEDYADSDDEEEWSPQQDQEEEGDVFSDSSSDDYVSGEEDLMSGDELLMKEYALLGPEAVKEQRMTRSILDETSKRLVNMTTSINRSRRLDNVFAQKQAATALEPELDSLLHRNGIKS